MPVVKKKIVLTKNVTAATIDKFKPREKEYLLADGVQRHLYLVVSPKGVKSWQFKAKVDGDHFKKRFGKWPIMSIDKAREKAKLLNVARDTGQLTTEKVKTNTFEAFAEEFLADKQREDRGIKTIHEYRKTLKGHVYPIIGCKDVADITRADIDAIINPLRDRKKGVMSNRVLAILRPIIKNAVARDILAKDVTGHVRKFNEAKNKTSRRALSIDELRLVWEAARHLPDGQRDGIRLILLTGLRKIEAFAARTADYDGKTLTIPAAEFTDRRGHTFPVSHAKNDRPHPLKLGPKGRAILDANKGGEYFFAEVVHKNMFHEVLPALKAALAEDGHVLETFDIHALRTSVRTAITSDAMRAHGHRFSADEGSIFMNHKREHLTEIYDRGDHRGMIEEMLAAWESLLLP
ncbi:DUF4102 domain-containing protein [Erythrobacter arachoides]|uniref:DUF4102 domain-containing protein n=1 Tax=Aurantiacibacter arachoides TaxID=1850444 RepID=A0A845A572_9SPHN|nr:integrase arm-type DNA-binding domain-containing protein [Aurantiacibacter arachoides]MXO94306.1 DUF4102 domain-containing protein [Aurantiacibacter arachoides]GGD64490.1 hypothetical protein GCM10011411_26020 [Aurantiacibacter arachoides]